MFNAQPTGTVIFQGGLGEGGGGRNKMTKKKKKKI